MTSEDHIQRFLLDELDIHGAHVRLTDSWQGMYANRIYPESIIRHLGEIAAVTAVLADKLKGTGKLSFQLRGDGKVPMMIVDCTDQLNIRGYASVTGEIRKEDGLAELLGRGRLMMTLELADAAQPFQSFVPIEGETLAQVFEHYIAHSEQQTSCLILTANAQCAAGLFLQKLPTTDLRDADGWSRITQLARTLRDEELRELSSTDLLTRLFHEEIVRIFEPRAITHDFPPDPEKIRAMVRSLGRVEIERIIAEQGVLVVDDDLSNNRYEFTAAEALAIFADQAAVSVPPHLH